MIASITEEDRQNALKEFDRSRGNVCKCCVINQVLLRMGLKEPFNVSGGTAHKMYNGQVLANIINASAHALSCGTDADWTPDIVGTSVVIKLTPEGWRQ